jgi:class 3 adenylate cyclase
MSVLFVDIAGSTVLLLDRPPEAVLERFQRFMRLVTEVALAHCGDVKDYEGDGALLYFESAAEATQAALAIRRALASEHAADPAPLQARMSLNAGSVVLGIMGSPLRRCVALIGPSINPAARMLKHVPPGGIIATEDLVQRLREQAPALAERFQVFSACLVLKGFEDECVKAFHVS